VIESIVTYVIFTIVGILLGLYIAILSFIITGNDIVSFTLGILGLSLGIFAGYCENIT